MNSITLLRHGEALHNVNPSFMRFGDENALPLTEHGFNQAVDSARELVKMRGLCSSDVVNVISSDLLRAQQTTTCLTHTLRSESGVHSFVGGYQHFRHCLREFYSVLDGSIPKGFDFDEFMKDPFARRYLDLNEGNGLPTKKIRTPLELFGDMTNVHQYLMEARKNHHVVVVGHHFTLNILRLVNHLVKVSGSPTLPREMFTEFSWPSQSINNSVKCLLKDALNIKLNNAEPLCLDQDEPRTLDGDSLRVRIEYFLANNRFRNPAASTRHTTSI